MSQYEHFAYDEHGEANDAVGDEAERGVIGSLLLDGGAFDRISGKITAAHFADHANALVFSAIAGLNASCKSVDAISVAEVLESRGELGLAGGLGRLIEIAQGTASAFNIRRYAEIVVEKATRRHGIAALAAAIEALRTPSASMSLQAILSATAGQIAAIAETGAGDSHMISAGEIAQFTLGKVDEAFNKGLDALPYIPTGLRDLDEQLEGGIYPGDLVILAGRPAMGKTAVAMTIADAMATPGHKNGGMVLVFSMEMGKDQIGPRQMAALSGVSLRTVRRAELEGDDWERLSVGVSRAADLRQLIDFRSGLSVEQIQAAARREKRKHKTLGAIVVDYLQLMADGRKRAGASENRTQEITHITRGLKELAREIGCPVIALSQLNRGVESRADKRPMMADLRESGSIEQDADTIVFLYRDEVYNQQTPEPGIIELIVTKQRMGETGKVRALFQGQFSRAVDLAKGWVPPPPPPSAPATKKRKDNGL